MTPPTTRQRPWLLGAGAIVATIAAAKLLLHLHAGRHYGYFVDELYYLACADHLASGCVDQPPLTAFIANIAAEVLLAGLIARELKQPLKELWPRVKAWR